MINSLMSKFPASSRRDLPNDSTVMDQAMSETLPPSDLLRFDLSGLPVTDADEEASSPVKALKLVLTTATRLFPGL